MELLAFIITVILGLLSPAIIMTVIGFKIQKRKIETAKILWLLSALYVMVGGGICLVITS